MKRGMALVTVLAIILVCSVLLTIAFYFIFRGTEISGIEKRYRTAKEASLGAIEIFTKEIIPYGMAGEDLTSILQRFPQEKVKAGIDDSCFFSKLKENTENWGGCSNSMDIRGSYDMIFILKGEETEEYDVFVKIVDTVSGNTGKVEEALQGAGVAESTTGTVPVPHFPYLYKIEVQGEKKGSAERAAFSILYAF